MPRNPRVEFPGTIYGVMSQGETTLSGRQIAERLHLGESKPQKAIYGNASVSRATPPRALVRALRKYAPKWSFLRSDPADDPAETQPME